MPSLNASKPAAPPARTTAPAPELMQSVAGEEDPGAALDLPASPGPSPSETVRAEPESDATAATAQKVQPPASRDQPKRP